METCEYKLCFKAEMKTKSKRDMHMCKINLQKMTSSKQFKEAAKTEMGKNL